MSLNKESKQIINALAENAKAAGDLAQTSEAIAAVENGAENIEFKVTGTSNKFLSNALSEAVIEAHQIICNRALAILERQATQMCDSTERQITALRSQISGKKFTRGL